MSGVDYAARVAKGAALLDGKRAGWEHQIDLETLEIRDGAACVTAQLSGKADWAVGMQQLDLGLSSYIAHGFNATPCSVDGCECECEGECPQQRAYATLNTLWKDLIRERIAAEPVQS